MKRLITEDKKAFLDDMLKRITEALQLSDSKRKLVEERYTAVSSFIESQPGLFLDANIYAQGSYRIRTTVKPRKGEEFDLDFVVQIDEDWTDLHFARVYDEFKKLLESDGRWSALVIGKNRCIRLNYADEFHMDIIPTCTENVRGDKNRIMIPDRSEHNWTISNPEGYAQWFEAKFIAQSNIYLHDFYPGMEVRAAQELPKDDPNHLKQPLQHAVQLIKRYRDVYFEKNPEMAPSSIVLTTLVGRLYEGENSIFETIQKVVDRFRSKAEYEKKFLRQFHVANPVLPDEIFTKEWNNDPKLFEAFVVFMGALARLWEKLQSTTGSELNNLLKESFGTGTFETAYKAQGLFMQSLRDKGLTGIHKGSGMAGIGVGHQIQKDRPNTFHGE
tara:strand:- start:15493 stop:16653 length:1161 start_codon:yes stop_codon:yes gene_type:complete